jgi:hypothetical protein
MQCLNIPTEASRTILNDIFGHRMEGNTLVEGLVDVSDSEIFHTTLNLEMAKSKHIFVK